MTQTPPSMQEQIAMRALLLACTPQAIEYRKVCAQVAPGAAEVVA
jgi:hypothetical protein